LVVVWVEVGKNDDSTGDVVELLLLGLNLVALLGNPSIRPSGLIGVIVNP
jgi:hypothetical protein